MNKQNYRRLMEEEIASLAGRKPKLLLHCCCAPCAAPALELLDPHFQIICYFYNPNLYPKEESQKRAEELARLLRQMPLSQTPKLIVPESTPEVFYQVAQGLEQERECGRRCYACYTLRLTRSLQEAIKQGCEYYTTTLTTGPMKPSQVLNQLGASLSGASLSGASPSNTVKWLPSDFKKGNGYARSLELSQVYQLYRQNYCGCEYSRRKDVP